MPSFSKSLGFCFKAIAIASVFGSASFEVVAVPALMAPGMASPSLPHAGHHNKTVSSHIDPRGLESLMSSSSVLDSVVQPLGLVGGPPTIPPSNQAPNVTRRSSTRRTHKGKEMVSRASSSQQNVQYYDSRIRGYYSDLKHHSSVLSSLAQKSYTVSSNDASFQSQAQSELTSYHSSLLGFGAMLKQLGADKGLANYDRSNSLETLLKDIVNLNKDTLSAVTLIVYNVPVLGKTLGPIVYQIKCILDDVLNTIENLVDALLNVLKPLLQPIIGSWFSFACRSGNGGLNLSHCPH